MKRFKWKILSESKIKEAPLKAEDILDILLSNRGIKTEKEKKEFLNPDIKSVTPKNVGIDLVELKKTIGRIEKAIDNNEKIIIYGDYDVDGICGTAILWETIYKDYKNVLPYIPHRVDEGYGLSVKGIDHLIENYGVPNLIITVDNGIVASDAVDYANKNKIDVIVTDHHVKGTSLPNAFSIVHTTSLCGTGVAYLLSGAIRSSKFAVRKDDKQQTTNDELLDNHLELVALATVADLVPLVNANRVLLKFGLEELRKTTRPGLLALFAEAAIKRGDIDTYHIGHIIAPRLNATGRVASAMDSLRLICTKDIKKAQELAQVLGQTNKDRQALTSESTLHANLITENITKDQKFIFVHNKDYNPGVIGLVASRLVEMHYRPSVVVSVGEKYSKGSARSIRGFNIIEFLRLHSEFLVDAGGHPMAAGFTVETEKLDIFKNALLESSIIHVDQILLERTLDVDMDLAFENITRDLYQEIKRLAPFGMANPEPLFMTEKVLVESISFVGRERKHLKLILSKDNIKFEAMMFGMDQTDLNVGDEISIAYVINNDTWNGNEKITLKIRDYQSD
ncbi:MAG TPA: single-stranded-DNA-specific exonuclease RecJ [Patescibacteria group bacterium]|nr:single-stranded-DNA-specific exonuclease RecJ [Patescibacteria group bacterium]